MNDRRHTVGATRDELATRPELLFDLGQKLGRLSQALQGFDHAALHRELQWDFASGLQVVRKNEKLIRDAELRGMVTALAQKFEESTLPLLAGLRRSAPYNDANDYNILLGGGEDLYSRECPWEEASKKFFKKQSECWMLD